ncbi:TonB-dependent receptor [Chitinophagaceae bacterium LB-8]|uniref:TonB-dependent receptor n=1 Tax=Paraflavisolibacter caeni TaxID=2982496 RepID=A0A9X2XYT3_9BACT|nr:outer membrane beta-barrel protein [Paraflavisolibacter caeni]MCU7551670.1 TonB-dependent receptor [Paraflavisolibacter caeni]
MIKGLLALLFTLLGIYASAQTTAKVTLTVLNGQKMPLENATVELLRSKDSALVKSALTDKSGTAEFENIKAETYFARISSINYTTHYTSIFQVSGQNPVVSLPAITLVQKEAKQLQGVTVNAKKPFIQKLNDRIVVNVESSIVSAGSSALDVLERAPGLTIDQNDVIALRGRQGVIIMIDGKPSPMSGSDLANYLRGLPSNAIERIDIITNPSAKYDAKGNSGIIDIRMKKDQRMGTNGTFTAGYGQGIYPKANTGTTFNYRNKKVNVFGNYNYSYREALNHLILDRNFFNNGTFSGADKKDNYAHMPINSHTARLGADFFLNKKTILGFVVNSNFNHFERQNRNNSLVIDNQKLPSYTFQTMATNDDHFNNTVANINLKHTFDSSGKELTADIDYGSFINTSLSSTATQYFNLDGNKQQPDYILNGDQDGKLTFKTAKADYVNPLKKGTRLEAGFKTSFVSSDNDAQFFDVSSGTPINDVNKTNRFLYDENNYAAYTNFYKEYKKFNIQLGLRAEQTNVNTHQVKGDVRWDSSYLQFFPSAFFNYKLKEDQTLGVSISRRIDRPGYRDLNPFLFLIDVSTYATGSPGLLPQLTWSYELSYTLKQLNFTLGYKHTKDVQNIAIVRFKDVFPNIPSDDNVTVQIPVNLESSDYYGLSVSAPIRISKWWNMMNNADLYYNHFNGNLAGTMLNNGTPAADIRTNNTFTFKKGWTAELNANFNSGGRYGYMVSKPQWGVTAGVQKSVLKNKGSIRFNVTDIFWTNLPKATITYNNYIENWHAYRESRVANLSFTYRFGKNTVAAARRRTTASEEERIRAGGN